MVHDIRMLEEKIDRLTQSISEFAKLPPGLASIIHRPGWTTLPEWQLVLAAIDSLQKQTEVMTEHCKRLLEAAEKVGTGAREEAA